MNRRQGGSLQQRPSPSEQRRFRRVLFIVVFIAAVSILSGVWWGMMSSGRSTGERSPINAVSGNIQQQHSASPTSATFSIQQQHVEVPENTKPIPPTTSSYKKKGVGTNSNSKKDRTPSDPFITGDMYRDIASIVIDETTVSSGSLSMWGARTVCQQHQSTSEVVAGGGGGGVAEIAAVFAKKGLVAPPTDIANILLKLKEAVQQHQYHNTTVFIQTHLMGFFVRCLLPRVEMSFKEVVEGGGGGGRLIILAHNSDYSTPYTPTNSRLKGGYQAQLRALASSSSSTVALSPPSDIRRGTTPTSSTSAFLSYFGADLQGVVQLDDTEEGVRVLGLRPPLTAWYGQNLVIRDVGGLSNFIKPLPIGIENRYNKLGRFVGVYEEMARAAPPFADRKKTLLVSFSLKTNPPERKAARDAAEKLATTLLQDSAKYGDMSVTFYHQPVVKGSTTTPEDSLKGFLRQLGEHQFVLAPKGHGVDTHRLWEAMYMGCVPIALDSPSFDFFPNVGEEDDGDVIHTITGRSFAHPSLPLWVLPNPFLPSPPPYGHVGATTATAASAISKPPPAVTASAASEGSAYLKYLTPTGLRSAQVYYSSLLARRADDGGDALSWLLAKFPTLSASYWRNKWTRKDE